jgi:hypothetical protein
MPAVGLSSNSVPPISTRCPTCNKKMVFISVTPTCQSMIYKYMCRNDGDRLSWECRQSHQQKAVSCGNQPKPPQLVASLPCM